MQVILADPPWQFRTSVYKGGTCAYPTMVVNDICALPVKKLCGPQAALFLWTTDAHLQQALKVMTAWGFQYKTIAFVWVKTTKKNVPVSRTGFYTRKSVEICLFGTKGTRVRQHLVTKPQQIVFAHAKRHSEKPKIVHELIEKMFPQSEKYELFARENRKEWKCWGNEIKCDFEL